MIYNYWTILILFVLGFVFGYLYRKITKLGIEDTIDETTHFLQTETAKSKIKLVLLLVKKLRNMKKYVGIGIVIIITFCSIVSLVILNDNRDYFKEVLEIQRNKLNLRNEASVDSLQSIIGNQTKTIDSISVVASSQEEKISTLEETIKATNKSVVNLQNVIKHQNQMINNLKK